ncbi:MAG: DUF359 domain-containing protein [Fervidicoccaceae archaeon]
MPLILKDENLRRALSNPMHPIYRGEAFKKAVSKLIGRKVVTVGDIVTMEYIKSVSSPPSVAFVDGFTKRGEKISSPLLELFEDYVEIYNERGEIDLELISEALSQVAVNFHEGIPTLVNVKGEEDMLALATPIFFSSPLTVLIYGQPDMGAIILELFYPVRDYFTSMLSHLSPHVGMSK